MTEPVMCLNCGTEMKPGKRTKTRIVRYTEYTCPNGCAPRSEGRLLPGRAPRSVIPKAKVDAKAIEDAPVEDPVIVGEDEPETRDEEEPKTEDDDD